MSLQVELPFKVKTCELQAKAKWKTRRSNAVLNIPKRHAPKPRPTTNCLLINMSSHVDATVDYGHLFKDYLEVRVSDTFGRGVYSKKAIVPGVEVVRSNPLVHVVSKKKRGILCDWCLTKKE